MQQYLSTPQHLFHVDIQCRPFNPIHKENWVSVAAYQYSFRLVGKAGKRQQWKAAEVLLNCPVSLISIAEITAKAAHGKVACPVCGLELVDIGKLSRGNQRHTQSIDCRFGCSERLIREAYSRTLNGLIEVPRGRPVFGIRARHLDLTELR